MSLLADLAPRPGRLRDALSIGGLCAAIVTVFMTLRIPEAGLAAYLVFFAYRPDANGTIAVAIVFSILSIIVVGLTIPLLGLVVDDPLARMALVAGITFVGMWLASATPLGPIASTLAMLLTFLVILPDVVDLPIPDEVALITRGVVWLVPMVFAAMATIGVLAYLFGRNSIAVLEDRLADRLAAAADRLSGRIDADTFAERVTAAPAAVEDLKKFAKFSNARADYARLMALDRQTLELMLAVAALDESGADETTRAALARPLGEADAMANAAAPPDAPSPLAAAAAEDVADCTRTVGRILTGGDLPEPPATAKESGGLGARLKEPRHWQFAAKVTLAAMACIFFFTGLEWVSIHTCLITCYYVSEATLGESIHKMVLRMTGCLIGAAIAVACLVFVIPRMDDIGQLAIIVFIVAAIGGWIGVGPERIAYAGFQITLAFFLVVLESFGTFGLNFGPSFDFEPATGRIIGILVGSLACAFAFVAFWPLPMRVDVADGIARAWRAMAARLRGEAAADRAAVLAGLGRARDLTDYTAFERAVEMPSLTPAWRASIDDAFRALAVSSALERRRARAGGGAVAGAADVAAMLESGADGLARGTLPTGRAQAPRISQEWDGVDPEILDAALLDRLREIVGWPTVPAHAPQPRPAPSLSPSPAA